MKKIFIFTGILLILIYAYSLLSNETTKQPSDTIPANELVNENNTTPSFEYEEDDAIPSQQKERTAPSTSVEEKPSSNPEQKETATPVTTINGILTAILPPKHRARITTITTESDGPDGDYASVEPDDTSGTTWVLFYDPVDTYTSSGTFRNTQELLTTLIHEYNHILTLNETQVRHIAIDVDYTDCTETEVIIDEGCAKSSAYITAFIKQFWTEEDRDAAYDASLDGYEEDFAYELFTDRPKDFVTEYAATNAAEDIAESFALFVMKSKPKATTKSNQKILFFYTYPELIELRTHMRSGILTILGR